MFTLEEMIARTGKRAQGFSMMIDHLRAKNDPLIIETGCSRSENNYDGDGMSTLIFDRYTRDHSGEFHTVDIDTGNIEFARARVSGNTHLHCYDSVAFLHNLNTILTEEKRKVDLLYLDSFDYYPHQELESSLHHIFELLAIRPSIGPGTMIAVDDNIFNHRTGSYKGKGQFVDKFMTMIGCNLALEAYQFIWIFK
ncbi:MAG: hypothetical protein EBU90_31485 [Proteobacteria bacterium]|nr:hypothetical protein [Pseudomonadota bacterium]